MDNLLMYVTIGISASGKSTWADNFCSEYDVVNINRDDIRFNLFCNGVRDWNLYKFTKHKEKLVTEHQVNLIKQARLDEKDVIISDTNLNTNTLGKLRLLADQLGYTIVEKWFDIDVMEAIKRDARRSNGVGYSVIMNQYEKYCKLRHGSEYHVSDDNKPKAIIVDIDGTVADMTGLRSPYDWGSVYLDKPVKYVIDVVKSLQNQGNRLIFMSGRDSSCRTETMKWLQNVANFQGFSLYMRAENDMRKDSVVKKELFSEYVNGIYSIQCVVDDRPSVCRMWRYELGLKVVQVGDPHLEF